MTNLKYLKEALDNEDMKAVKEVIDFLKDESLGICETEHCPFRRECGEDCDHVCCKLSEEKELEIWFNLETKF